MSNNIETTKEIKQLAAEYLENCPYLHNIKKARSEWAKMWEDFCPRGGSVSFFVPDDEED